ncbi:MAG: winged helix-turn-helix transcriptional regulator [Rhodospirillales bacterium]|nr:winged helix-turn-helix transcriptional regulator [Rhodospirillales bacterium]
MNDPLSQELLGPAATSSGLSTKEERLTTFFLFNEIEREGVVSQESLATRLGVAVGLTNAYIKRCVRKGLIKMQKVPARRYAYFLTPTGFAEKGRLTAEYLSHSFDFFRRARSQSYELLHAAHMRGLRRIVLIGADELAEVAVLSALEISGLKLVGVVSPGRNATHFAGLPVFNDLQAAGDFDAVMVTDTSTPRQTYEELRQRFEEDRILLAPLLHIVRR